MAKPETVLRKATASLKWSALMEIVTRVAQPVVFLVLARLLTPEDFGVAGTAMVVITFSQMFWDAGLGKALVQTEGSPEDAANVVFWINMALGLAVYGAIWALAPRIAEFFRSPATAPVLRVLGLQAPILSATSVQQSLFMRDLDFRQLFWTKLAVAAVPGLLSVPLALAGFGVWALVAGTLAGSLTNLLILWARSPWRPSLSFDRAIARRLVVFGAWVLAEGLGGWFIMWGDQLLVGRFLSVHDLGVYRVAANVTALVFALLLNPFLPVLYPTFSRLQDDRDRMKQVFARANRFIISLAMPVSVGLLILGDPLASALFGDRWRGLGFVLGVLGFSHGVAWIVQANAELYRAIGRPDINTKFMYFQLPAFALAYLLSIGHGLHVFVVAKGAVCIATIGFHAWLCARVLGFPYTYLWTQGKFVYLATAAMALLVLPAMKVATAPGMPALPVAGGLVLLGAAAYGAALWVLDRPFVLDARQLFRRVVAPG